MEEAHRRMQEAVAPGGSKKSPSSPRKSDKDGGGKGGKKGKKTKKVDPQKEEERQKKEAARLQREAEKQVHSSSSSWIRDGCQATERGRETGT